MKKKLLVVAAVMTSDGSLSLTAGSLTTHIDSVIKAVDNDVAVTIQGVADGPSGGKLDETGYPAIVFHFEDGVTTVTEFETLVTDSHHLILVTPGTGANVLTAGGDVFVATALATGTINSNTDIAVVDVSNMTNISMFVNQLVDSGTCTLVLEKTIDGVNWASAHANLSEASFATGANKAVEITLSDTNGMATVAKQLRVSCTAYGASGTYTLTASGLIDA